LTCVDNRDILFKRGLLMKKYAVFSMLLLFSITVVSGQGFNGPGSRGGDRPDHRRGQAVTASRPVTVREAKTLPDGSWVILTGNISSGRPGGENYTFRDPTGEITVEIERDVWRGLSVSPADRIEISGELEKKRGRAVIEVEFIVRAGTLTRPVTVSEAGNLPNHSWVVLTGTIVNSLRDEYYTFRDPTGEITVEIERGVWRGLSVGISDRVEICGEVKITRGQVSFKVHAIRKIEV
jgi:uncharacterized protein (TIGR00156 family)